MSAPIIRARGVMHKEVLSTDGMSSPKEATAVMRASKESELLVAKCAAAFPLVSFERDFIIALGILKGEIGDHHPLIWNYFDLFVPDIAIGRDAVYARTLDEGLVTFLHRRKYGMDTSGFASNSSSKIKIDIHYETCKQNGITKIER